MEAINFVSPVFKQKNYLTDGGLETDLIFNKDIALKHFAAFELLGTEEGRNVLAAYYKPYLSLAEKYKMGFVMESPTWRASYDWGVKLGYTHDELFALNKRAIKFIRELALPFSQSLSHILVSGNIGPRGDGYKADVRMTVDQAKAYHLDQVKAFAFSDADVVTAMTITCSDEAIGIIQAGQSFQIPVVVSFTLETDCKLPSGETLQEAIDRTDKETNNYVTHYMINCAHPRHFVDSLTGDGNWKQRIGGIRANASVKSHAELDESEELDAGDKCLLADGYVELFQLLPSLKVVGGCCGTDWTHIEEICEKTVEHLEIPSPFT